MEYRPRLFRNARKSFRYGRWALFSIALLRAAPSAIAGEGDTPPIETIDWFAQEKLTGDWAGGRSWLERRGVQLDITIAGEFYRASKSRISRGSTGYHGGVDVEAFLDPSKMGGWEGGTFYFFFEHLHGRPVALDEPVAFDKQPTFAPIAYNNLSEYWFKQELLDGKFAFKIGKQDMGNEDFAYSDYASRLAGDSAGEIPIIGFTDNAFGLALWGRPHEAVTLAAGIWDGGPRNEDANWGVSGLAWETLVDGRDGFFQMGEISLDLEILHDWHPGTFKAGAWHHFDGVFEKLPRNPNAGRISTEEENYGFYCLVDQQIFEEHEDQDDDQGLGLFLQFGWVPSDRNPIRSYVGGGLSYTGLFPSRDEDTLTLGIGHSFFSDRFRTTERLSGETRFELSSEIKVNQYLTLIPTVQFAQKHEQGWRGSSAWFFGLLWDIEF